MRSPWNKKSPSCSNICRAGLFRRTQAFWLSPASSRRAPSPSSWLPESPSLQPTSGRQPRDSLGPSSTTPRPSLGHRSAHPEPARLGHVGRALSPEGTTKTRVQCSTLLLGPLGHMGHVEAQRVLGILQGLTMIVKLESNSSEVAEETRGQRHVLRPMLA